MPVRELVLVKLLNRLIPSQLIDTSCTVYVKGDTPVHPREREPLLTHLLHLLRPQVERMSNPLLEDHTKYNCQRRDALHADDDTQSAREEKNLTSWLNAWTDSLCSTAIAALDLANHEPDYLLNHWYSFPSSLGSQIVVLRTCSYQAFTYS